MRTTYQLWCTEVTNKKREPTMAKQYDKQFKLDAVQYYLEHRELGLKRYASNLSVSYQTFACWKFEAFLVQATMSD